MHDVGVIAIIMVFSVPLAGIYAGYRHEMMKLKLKMMNQGDANLQAKVDALQQEVRALRETSMQYDLSFDTALQRMEARVEGLERRTSLGQDDTQVNQINAGR